METKQVQVKDGEYICDIDVSVDEWKEILQDQELFSENYKNTLLKFYNEPDHKATCKAIGDKYNLDPQSVNGTITAFAKAVQKKLNRFEVLGTKGDPTYWIIPMKGKKVGEHFEWTLRKELAQAMNQLNLTKKHTLQLIYDEAIKSKHWVFSKWFPKYKRYVQEYKDQAINNSWTDQVFQRLIKDTKDNGISALQQKNFTWEEFNGIKQYWSEIQPLIYDIAQNNSINKNEFQKIKTFFKKFTSENRPTAIQRVVAAFLPNFVTTVVNYKYLKDLLKKFNLSYSDYPTIEGNWLIDNINFINYCNSKIHFIEPWHSSLFSWYLIEEYENESVLTTKNEKAMQKYIGILRNNKNLILTGAPGTGKTYLAREIAQIIIKENFFDYINSENLAVSSKQDYISSFNSILNERDENIFELMNVKYTTKSKEDPSGSKSAVLSKLRSFNPKEQLEFVQFHPSYDYTDFVEGLRPLKKESSELGFELKDGVFKVFCQKAAKNLADSKKSKEELQKQKTLSENLSLFIEKVENEIADNGKFILYGIGGKKCAPIIEINANNFITKSASGNTLTTPLSNILSKYENYEKHRDLNWTFKEVGEKLAVTYHHTYFFAFIKAFDSFLKKNKIEVSEVEKIQRKEFVFIIDEINRAEISKVFGELFFSIDPGYRGEKGKVKTQYSNLQEDDDIFKDGFFIPENLYILGTMNDIDRSVETFDFAMRRRFAWKEIKANDRISMWDGAIDEWKAEAEKRMKALNTKIKSIQGLGEAFHIGPAYFLKLKNYKGDFAQLWEMHLEGVLFEYLRGFPEKDKHLKDLELAYKLELEANKDAENDG